jgi:hypothetical protein
LELVPLFTCPPGAWLFIRAAANNFLAANGYGYHLSS